MTLTDAQLARMSVVCRDCDHTLEIHTHHHSRTYCGHLGCRCSRFRRRRWWNA